MEEQGYDYPVAATLEDCWFPTKEYEGFALPAGNYTALPRSAPPLRRPRADRRRRRSPQKPVGSASTRRTGRP